MALKKGDTAPEFNLFDTDRKQRSLKEFLGKKTVIATIPGAFTSVCTEEICTFRDSIKEFEQLGAHIVVIDVDSPFVNKAYADGNNVSFPILSDFSRKTVTAYGGVHEDFAGMPGYSAPKRSAFVLNRQGKVEYAWISENPGALPPFDEIKTALSSFD